MMLVNQFLIQRSILGDDHTTGSNHEAIESKVNVDRQEEVDHARILQWNLAAISMEDMEAAETLLMELAKDKAHLHVECTADKVE